MLSDEQIKAAVSETTNDMLDHIYENGTGSEFVLRSMMKAARTIEAAATEPLLKRIAELEQERDQWKEDALHGGNAAYLRDQLEAVRKDAERYRFLKSGRWGWSIENYRNCLSSRYVSTELDAAIDAAKERT